MRKIRLKIDLLVGTVNYPPGSVVLVPDIRAQEIVANRAGEIVEDAGTADNEAVVNKLGDSIDPLPPGMVAINTYEANAANVATSPDLGNLVVALGKVDQVGPDGSAARIRPVSTLDNGAEIRTEDTLKTVSTPVSTPNVVHPDVEAVTIPEALTGAPEAVPVPEARELTDDEKAASLVADSTAIETATRKPGSRNASRISGKAD